MRALRSLSCCRLLRAAGGADGCGLAPSSSQRRARREQTRQRQLSSSTASSRVAVSAGPGPSLCSPLSPRRLLSSAVVARELSGRRRVLGPAGCGQSARVSCFHSSAAPHAGGSGRDLYAVLGVARTASKEEIKRAYFSLAKRFHPDTNKQDKDAADKFAEVSNAYEVLSDDDRRQRYDVMGAAGEEMGGGAGGGGGGMGGAQAAGGMNPEDILRDFFGSMGAGGGRSPFGFDMSGGGRAGSGGRRAAEAAEAVDGDDIEVVLPLSFMEAVQGCSKLINVSALAACPTCQGSGNQPNTQPSTCKACGGKGVQSLNQGFFKINTTCSQCGGRGRSHPPCTACQGEGAVRERRSVNVTVPAGVDSHHHLKVSGQGDAGRRGGVNGDIRVRLNIAPHPVFHRDGNDVHVSVSVPMSTAVLGGSVTVPTLTGEAVLKVDPGTQPGERRVMRGKGIRDVARPSSQGAQYVTFSVQIPSQLTVKQRQLMQSFADDRGEQQTADEQQQQHSRAANSSGSSSSGSGGSRAAGRAGGVGSAASSSSGTGFFSGLFGGSKSDKAAVGDEQQPSGSRDAEPPAPEGERKRKQTAGNKAD